MNPYLSIIIPAHNEAMRLGWSLHRLYNQYLYGYLRPYEVLIVDNGSTDGTARLVDETYFYQYPNIQLLELEQAGKGLAVRAGMLAARGQWRVMCDADFSMDPAWLRSLLPEPGGDPFDICITTRNGPTAQRLNERPSRHLAGLVFNWIVRAVTGLPFRDTQCGFKSFSARAAEDIFSRCVVDGFAFDVEALYIAMLRMYTIKEVAITWQAYDASTVRVIRDSYRMFRDVLAIRRTVDRSTVQPLELFL